jgi:hypothetical protein
MKPPTNKSPRPIVVGTGLRIIAKTVFRTLNALPLPPLKRKAFAGFGDA